jgi:hypothetical protein
MNSTAVVGTPLQGEPLVGASDTKLTMSVKLLEIPVGRRLGRITSKRDRLPVPTIFGGPSVFERKARFRALPRITLLGMTLAAFCGVLVAPASAATAVPESATHCGGNLTPGKATADDPHQLAYKFNCDYAISSYTLLVNRSRNDYSTVDDFSSSAGVFDDSGTANSKESFGCSGSVPGDGVNCNAGGGVMTAPEFAEGTLDTTDPYCASIPPGSPAGTQPEPTAIVQLVVTDATGAEDGPFRLSYNGRCPAVHVVKPKARVKAKARAKAKAKQHRGRATNHK